MASDKELYDLKYSPEGPSYADIARRYGLSKSSVRGRVGRHKRKLAKQAAAPAPELTLIVSPFPDKKRAEPPTFARVTAELQRRQAYANAGSVSQDNARWNPMPQYPDLPIAVTWLSDAHYGSLYTDYALLQRHLDIIKQTPNMYVAIGGDEVDNFNAIKYGDAIWSTGATPEEQMRAWAHLLDDLDGHGKLAAMTWGNHTEFSNMAGINPFSAFFGRVSCPMFVNGGGRLTTRVGMQSYTLGMRHTYWGGSKLNLTNASKRMIQFWREGLDVAFLAHTHYAAYEDYYYAGAQKVAVIGGTYKLYDKFRQLWGDDAHPGGITVLLYPDRKFVQPCRYPDIAQDILLGKIARRRTRYGRAHTYPRPADSADEEAA